MNRWLDSEARPVGIMGNYVRRRAVWMTLHVLLAFMDNTFCPKTSMPGNMGFVHLFLGFKVYFTRFQ